MKIQSVTHRG